MLGYAGVDNEGLEGLERALDAELVGKPGRETIVKDPFGRVIDVISSTVEERGADVTLTLDNQIQAGAEAVLRDTVRRWNAKAGTAVVLDPKTGAVLAMAVAPGYDANRFPAAPADSRRNRAVTDTYEPGSTFKLVTVAGALSEGLVAPSTKFTLRSSIQVADRVINEHAPRPTQRLSVAQILSQSSNVGTITLAQLLGKHRLYSWIAQVRLRAADRARPSRREPRHRAPAGSVVGLDDRQHPDRAGHRRHARADGRRLRGDREPRRLAGALPRRAHRHGEQAPDDMAAGS